MMLDATPHAPLVLDIAGTSLDAADRHRLKHPLTGGLILFARNCESRAQITALTAEIKSLRPDVLIAIDHEGGRVQRMARDGFTHLPPMRVLGELWMQDALKATAAASACGLRWRRQRSSTWPKSWRRSPAMVMKRQGRSHAWSGARSAAWKIPSSTAAAGAGSTSLGLELRCCSKCRLSVIDHYYQK